MYVDFFFIMHFCVSMQWLVCLEIHLSFAGNREAACIVRFCCCAEPGAASLRRAVIQEAVWIFDSELNTIS
jgi:hypothetical protein